jgi:hypothetical protein
MGITRGGMVLAHPSSLIPHPSKAMSLTSQDVGNFAPGYKFTHKGRVYELRFVDDKLLAEFEREWFDLERDKLRARKEDIIADLGEAYYQKLMKRLYHQLNRQEFTLAAYKEDDPDRNPGPGLQFMAKIVQVTVPELVVLLKESPELKDLIEQIVQESSPKQAATQEGNGQKKSADSPAAALALPRAGPPARAGDPAVL